MTTGRINQVSCYGNQLSDPIVELALSVCICDKLSAWSKCIGAGIQLVIVLSIFQSPLRSTYE